MKIPNLIVSAVVLACIYLTSCVNGDPAQDLDYSSDRKNEYTKNWVKTFGLIDASQDWCMVTAVNATVMIDGKIDRVKIYNDNPVVGGHLIGSTKNAGSMKIDMPEGAKSVYARRVRANGKTVDEGYYTVNNGRLTIDGSGTALNKAASRDDDVTYAHTPSYFDAMIICEDLGDVGDFDFNDIVIGLKHVSGDKPSLTLVPMAAGGTLTANIYFKDKLLGEIHDMIRAGSPSTKMLNTETNNIGSVSNLNTFDIDISEYAGWNIADNWSDIKIEVVDHETTEIITKPTTGTAPQMICLGGDWFWPQERVDLKRAYTGFATWSCEANAITWLGNWNDGNVVKWSVPAAGSEPDPEEEDTRMWFKVTTTDGNPYTLRLNGSATETQEQSGEKIYITSPLTSCKEMFTVYSDALAFILNRDGSYTLGHPIAQNNILSVEFSDGFDMSAVTSFELMFAGCASLNSVNVADWDKPGTALTTTESMFKGCSALTSLDLSGWDVSNATVFYDTFSGCTALQTLNLDGWNFASGADLRYFLENTSNLTVKCSAEAEATLRAVTQLGSSSITFTRP